MTLEAKEALKRDLSVVERRLDELFTAQKGAWENGDGVKANAIGQRLGRLDALRNRLKWCVQMLEGHLFDIYGVDDVAVVVKPSNEQAREIIQRAEELGARVTHHGQIGATGEDTGHDPGHAGT